jgi:hypothetical protein
MAWFGFGFVTPAAEEAGGDPVAALDAWTDNGTGVSLGAAGSKTVSAGTDRVLMAHTTTVGGTGIPVTALSWGGQAMDLVESGASTAGRDMDSATWILDEAGIAAGSGTAFAVTPATGSVQFRIRAGSYENVDQTNPVVDSFSEESATAGADPASSAMTTVDEGMAVVLTAINRGTSDAGTEDMAYGNATERVEDNASSQQYASVADAATTGASFTPSITSTQTSGRVHLHGVTLRKA